MGAVSEFRCFDRNAERERVSTASRSIAGSNTFHTRNSSWPRAHITFDEDAQLEKAGMSLNLLPQSIDLQTKYFPLGGW